MFLAVIIAISVLSATGSRTEAQKTAGRLAVTFRLLAHGPILDEADGMDAHKERRDLVGALEKKLAEDLAARGYEVMNTVNCLKPLDEQMYAEVRAAFASVFREL